VVGVKPGEARADDDRVDVRGRLGHVPILPRI
jgi:hypothetical protein